jgi:cytochrome c biogenesis protein
MRIINIFSSMNTGLVLLALIGITSAIGSSLLPESFFKTVPFRLLLLLLLINMILCTFQRGKMFIKHKVQINRSWGILIRNISLLMLHTGIVLILIGASLYSYLGHNAQLSILEGDTVEIDRVIHTAQPFSLKLVTFIIDFYEDGSPSQYYSELEIKEKGKPTFQETISVNNPLNYAGIKAYQSSYGYLTDVLIDDISQSKRVQAKDGDIIQFIGTDRTVKVFRYIPHFDEKHGLESRSQEALNPRVVYSVYQHQNLLGVGAASLGEQIEIDEGVFITFNRVRSYSVLTVKSDPGLPLVTVGGLLLMLGVCLGLLGTRRGNGKEMPVN